MKKLLLLILLALGLSAEAQQTCFGSSCGNAGASTTVSPSMLKDATYCPDLGATDAYVCSMVSAPSAYAAGMLVTLSANTENTGAAFIDVNGLGSIEIRRADGSTLVTGDIAATGPVLLEYHGATSKFRMLSTPAFMSAVSGTLAGYVGVGSAAPLTRLYVNNDWVTNQGQLAINANSGQRYSGLSLQNNGTAKALVYHDNTDSMLEVFASTSQGIRFYANSTLAASIASSGLTTAWILARSPTYASGSDVALTVQGSLSGNILNLKNSGGTTLSYFDSTGKLFLPSNLGLGVSGDGVYGSNYTTALVVGSLGHAFSCQSVGNPTGCAVLNSLTLGWTSASSSVGDLLLSREAAATLQMGVDVNGAAVNQTFKAHDGITGSNIAGASLTTAAGRGTGNATPADRAEQTAVPVGSGTTAQTLGDRVRVIGKYTDLTEATATAFARVAVAASTVAGGDIVVTVEANDATDFQARTLTAPWSASNKAGTLTLGLGTPSEAVAVSAGTLTCTITFVDSGSGNADFKADCTSSLTQTVLRANAQVRKNFGTGAISAQ